MKHIISCVFYKDTNLPDKKVWIANIHFNEKDLDSTAVSLVFRVTNILHQRNNLKLTGVKCLLHIRYGTLDQSVVSCLL